MALGVMLLGAAFTVPSAVAQAGGGADTAGGGAPTQRFLVIDTKPSEKIKPVVLGFGPIHDKGVDKQVSGRKDIFRFPNGSLIIRHHRTSQSQSHDSATCLFRFTERGTYRVVRGTGDYLGVHGHGHYVVHGKFVACSDRRPPAAYVVQIRAHGPLRL